MDKRDVEMEDTENYPHYSGRYVKESDKNATAGPEDAEVCENGEEDPCESEVSDTATSGMESQINPKNEVNDPMNAEGSFEGQINSERENDLWSNVQEHSEKKQDGGEGSDILRDDSNDNKTDTSLMEGQISLSGATTDDKHRGFTNKSLAIAVEQKVTEVVDAGNNYSENKQLPSEAPLSLKCNDDGNTVNTISTQSILPPMAEDDDGTPEEQATFLKEIKSFHRKRAVDFKFFNRVYIYGKQLNILKFWRAVIRLGGYDRVERLSSMFANVGQELWTLNATIYVALQCFYKKYVLEYERHKTQSGELQLPEVIPPEPEASGVGSESFQGSGSERASRDAASWSMPGSSANRSGHSEAREPVMKDKSSSNVTTRKKKIKFIVSGKGKSPIDADQLNKAARIETSTEQLLTSVLDFGPSADWVKINVTNTRDCFQVFGLVPGFTPNEIRVQSDPAGRLVIMGQPQRSEKLRGVVPFHKIVVFPERIDPSKTRAYVKGHVHLYVSVPFEQSEKKSR